VIRVTDAGVSMCTGEAGSSVLSRFSSRAGELGAAASAADSSRKRLVPTFSGAIGAEAGNLKGGAKRSDAGSGLLESSFWLSASKSGSISTASVYFAISMSSTFRESKRHRAWRFSRSRPRRAAWSRTTFAKLMRPRFAVPCISARLRHMEQSLRNASFSERKRCSSIDIDEADSCPAASDPFSSGVWESKYTLRILGVTKGRRFGGTTFKFMGAIL